MNESYNHKSIGPCVNRIRFAVTALLVVGCATVSQSPMQDQTKSIEFRFEFPVGATAQVESTTTVQTNWPQFAEPLDETIHEKSQLNFETGSASESQTSESGKTNLSSPVRWVSFKNHQLDYSSSFAPPVSFANLLRGMQFRFAVTNAGAGQEFEPIRFDRNALAAAKNQKPLEFHRRFARETAWPAWLTLLNGRVVIPGKSIQFEVVDYPVGCLGPIATTRDAELRIPNTVTCPEHVTTMPAQTEHKEQCVNVSLTLNTSKANIIRNMKDTLGPGDHEDILSSLVFNEATCNDSVNALINPKTLRIYQVDYSSTVDLTASNSTFKDGIQTITSKHLSKSTRYEWHDNQ